MTITYPEDNVTVRLDEPGPTLLQVSLANKIPHLRECGGQGRCTTCRVRILDGIGHVSARTRREADLAAERGWDDYTRLACQTRAVGDVTARRLVRTPEDVSMLQVDALHAKAGQELPTAILICDIRQFTPFVDAHLPYDVYHILNRFFSDIGEPILLNDGYIYQYVGDQIIGLFGLRGGSAEDACLGATRAGLGMMRMLDAFNEQIEEAFGVRLGIRIGAHFGPLIVGSMGHPTRREFGVVGDAINVTSRIESMNETLGTTFLVSETFYEHVPASLEVGFRGSVALKGKTGRHTLVELCGFAQPDAVSLVQATATRLIGDQERFGAVFYRRLFEAAPAVRSMFTEDMTAQGRMLAQTMHLALAGLSRFEQVVPGLVALGRQHVGYGVQPAHFEIFRDVFLASAREVLGPAFGAAEEGAWAWALDQVLGAMKEGVHAPHPHGKDAPAGRGCPVRPASDPGTRAPRVSLPQPLASPGPPS